MKVREHADNYIRQTSYGHIQPVRANSTKRSWPRYRVARCRRLALAFELNGCCVPQKRITAIDIDANGSNNDYTRLIVSLEDTNETNPLLDRQSLRSGEWVRLYCGDNLILVLRLSLAFTPARIVTATRKGIELELRGLWVEWDSYFTKTTAQYYGKYLPCTPT